MDSFEKVIREFAGQLTYRGLTTERLNKLAGGQFDAVVVVGMGGSGLAGEILRCRRAAVGLKLPVFLWKDYGLPELAAWGVRSPLYVFVSFSGNTEETLSGLGKLPRGAKAAVLAAGGQLIALARRQGLAVITFNGAGLTPRQATGRMFYGLIEILHASRLIPRRIPAGVNLTSPFNLRARGQKLARSLHRRLTAIYTDEANRDLGYIWKIKLNETAKTPAFANIVPEMNHNEIVSYEKPVAPTAVILMHSAPGRLKKRFDIFGQVLRKYGARVETIDLTGRGLDRVWNALILAEWTTFFLAKLNKVDPSAVKIVERLKALMRTP